MAIMNPSSITRLVLAKEESVFREKAKISPIKFYIHRMELSKTEEQLMKHLWSLERCFLKDH